ncbi:hypothetical protein V6N11_053341 [Hibiscus sabdariffa]|uniref:PWWP domain-containing protein n=1 Tax=Hibiscus sabdariffa TaxID=183260 RepID=A0ABR2UD26_9ROSI
MHLFSILAKTIMCESQKGQATEGNGCDGGKTNDNNEGEEISVGEVSLGDLIWIKLRGNSWWPAVVVDENSVIESSKLGSKSRGKVLVRLYGSHEYLYVDPMKYHSEFKTILEQNNGNHFDILEKTLEQLRRKSIKPKGQGSKATGKTSKQDETPKKLKRKSPSTDKHAKSKADEQSRVQKKQRKNDQTAEKKKPNGRSTEEKPKSSTSKEQKRGKTSKQREEQKKSKPNNPRTSKEKNLLKEGSQSSEGGTSPGDSPKTSNRRTRVMQGLGLIAPPAEVKKEKLVMKEPKLKKLTEALPVQKLQIFWFHKNRRESGEYFPSTFLKLSFSSDVGPRTALRLGSGIWQGPRTSPELCLLSLRSSLAFPYV